MTQQRSPSPETDLSTTRNRTTVAGIFRPLLLDGKTLHGLLLAVILLSAFTLRIWGVRHSLPFVYSPDERQHFVPYAISFFQNGYNPKYFLNPPGYSYLLHAVYLLRYGGGRHAMEVFSANPGELFLTARVVTAILGTLTVWLVYLIARRLFDRRVALVSSALMAVAFLPTFYSHRALNDVPTLVPVAVSLFASAGILLRGKYVDYLVAGAGLGLACASKYLGGVVLAPLLVAAAIRLKQEKQPTRVLAAVGLGTFAAIAAFFVANPFAFLDYRAFFQQIEFVSPQRFVTGKVKLGTRIDHGVLFYLWTMTWGLGWIPAIASASGAVVLAVRDRLRWALLVPAPILYVLFMGSRHGYFSRYLLPIYPFLVVLAGYSVVALLDGLRDRLGERWAEIAAAILVMVLLLGQSLAHSVHADIVLTRPNTRTLARQWIFRHIPLGSPLFVDPIYLDLNDRAAYRLPGGPKPTKLSRWRSVPLAHVLYRGGYISKDQLREGQFSSAKRFVTLLRPQLVDVYFRYGVCWVIAGSGQWGRAFNDPEKVPQAVAYYNELARRARVALKVTPESSERPLPYDLDLSNNLYRFEASNPGPEIIVYSIPAARCPSVPER